jgi:hypothetical protein
VQADKTTVWLSPDLVNFDERIAVSSTAGRSARDRLYRPGFERAVEDVRTRADRQHPLGEADRLSYTPSPGEVASYRAGEGNSVRDSRADKSKNLTAR